MGHMRRRRNARSGRSNTFSSDQFDSWRSITVWRNGNYSAEVGWYVDEDVDQFAHPYKTWVNDGIPHTDELSFQSIYLVPGITSSRFTTRTTTINGRSPTTVTRWGISS
jgi:hypothetical protein